MKTKINLLKIVLLASICTSFLLNSCSLIGFGIGAAVDSKTPKTSNIYKNQIDTLEIGNKVEIILFDGKKKYGKFGGIVEVYDQNFHREYNIIKNSLASQVNMPNVNDTLLIFLSNEKNVGKLGLFKGFESGRLWYKHFYSNEYSDIELARIDNFIINYEYNVDSVQINDLIVKQTFPNFMHLKIDTHNKTSENLPLVAVSKIQITNKRNAKFIGLGVGLAIDVIISAMAIKSMQDMSFEMSL